VLTGDMNGFLQLVDSGIGILALFLLVILHSMMTARWAGRMETRMDAIKEELPTLRRGRHDAANQLTYHGVQLKDLQVRLRAHQEEINNLQGHIVNITRLDDRLQEIRERLVRIEDQFRER
jgi:chromosome segregation ATPase